MIPVIRKPGYLHINVSKLMKAVSDTQNTVLQAWFGFLQHPTLRTFLFESAEHMVIAFNVFSTSLEGDLRANK